ncbi:hypothetical protein [Mesorhizobium sp. M1396]|uniref:hypothetical protein n=1 Tax=Mesorhizobium sp. M1396 TaxID=2957095 RepID=UPI003334FDDF
MLTTKDKAKALAMAKEIGDKVRVEEITPKPKRRKRRQHPAIKPARCRARLSAAAVSTTTAAARLAEYDCAVALASADNADPRGLLGIKRRLFNDARFPVPNHHVGHRCNALAASRRVATRFYAGQSSQSKSWPAVMNGTSSVGATL